MKKLIMMVIMAGAATGCSTQVNHGTAAAHWSDKIAMTQGILDGEFVDLREFYITPDNKVYLAKYFNSNRSKLCTQYVQSVTQTIDATTGDEVSTASVGEYCETYQDPYLDTITNKYTYPKFTELKRIQRFVARNGVATERLIF